MSVINFNKATYLIKEETMKSQTNQQPHFKILILDDNEFYNQMLSRFLISNLKQTGLLKGFTVDVLSFTTYNDCIKHLDSQIDILFTDYYLSDGYNATHIINFINQKLLKCKVVVVSQIKNLQTSLVTMLSGACEFIRKDERTMAHCHFLAEAIIAEKLGVTN